MLSGSAEAGAFSHEWSNISCQPESPEIYGWFVCGLDVPSSKISGIFLVLSLLVVQRHFSPLFGGLGTRAVLLFLILLDNHNLNNF